MSLRHLGVVIAVLCVFAWGFVSSAQAQYSWTGASSSDPTVAGNWASSYVPTIGAINNDGLWTSTSVALNFGPVTTTTFGVSSGNYNGLSWLGQGYYSTVNVNTGTVNLNGAFPNDGGTESVWVANGSYYTTNLTINGGYVTALNGTLLGRDTSTGNLSISNGSYTTGAFSTAIGTYLGAPFGSGTGVGTITIGNAGRFALLAAATDPFIFGGTLKASVTNTSGSYINFTTGSTGSMVLNLSSATLGANYISNLITNHYVRINGTVDTTLAHYSINTTNLSAATLALTGVQTFVHPGLSHSLADLNRMKNNTTVEPYKTAYAAFSSTAFAQSNNTGQGPFTYETYGHGQFEIRNDAEVAHWNAIMWYVTGNTAYRTNAINIINGWVNTLTTFDQTDCLTAGTALFDFCNAGEILRATGGSAWTPAMNTNFQNWMLTYLYPPCLSNGNSIAANYLQAAGWGGLEMTGLVAIGIYTDRADIYNFGVSSLQHNGTYTYGLAEYVNVSGQNYETQRDTGHSSGNVGAFATTFWMIYNQGTDLFSLYSNLLAKAFESQAKIDENFNVAPVVWTAADGTGHNSITSSQRWPYDNLRSDLAYNVYHNIKGLAMPYTSMSANIKFPDGGSSFMYRVDNSGVVPVAPPYGEPAAKDVVVFPDYDYSGDYLVHLAPGSYTKAQLNAAGVGGGQWGNGSNTIASIQVPNGWSVTAYEGDNFTGNSIVITSSQIALANLNFNQDTVSLIVTAGTQPYIFSNGTYKLISKHSGLAADVSGASSANGTSLVQQPYASTNDQLWSVQNLGNNQYEIQNLNSNKVMEIPGASLTSGTVADQSTYVGSANLAIGGTATASNYDGFWGHLPSCAFDGNLNTYWGSPNAGELDWLQTQLPTAQVVNSYWIVAPAASVFPSAWTFLGSNDGTTWTTLDTQTGQNGSKEIYTFTNTTAYTYYRLNMTAIYGGSSYPLELSELQLYNTSTAINQKWTITGVSGSAFDTYFNITNANSNQLLDVNGNSTANGATLIQYPSNGQDNQQWTLSPP